MNLPTTTNRDGPQRVGISLANLPQELILEIASNLRRPSSLFALSFTCKSLRNMFGNTELIIADAKYQRQAPGKVGVCPWYLKFIDYTEGGTSIEGSSLAWAIRTRQAVHKLDEIATIYKEIYPHALKYGTVEEEPTLELCMAANNTAALRLLTSNKFGVSLPYLHSPDIETWMEAKASEGDDEILSVVLRPGCDCDRLLEMMMLFSTSGCPRAFELTIRQWHASNRDDRNRIYGASQPTATNMLFKCILYGVRQHT